MTHTRTIPLPDFRLLVEYTLSCADPSTGLRPAPHIRSLAIHLPDGAQIPIHPGLLFFAICDAIDPNELDEGE